MSVSRRYVSRFAVVAGLLMAVSMAGSGLSATARAPAHLLDAPDWPTAISTGSDGAVWLAMATDVATGGVVRLDANLKLEYAWGLASAPSAVAAANGAVYVDEHPAAPSPAFDLISRFAASGMHVQSWDSRMFVLDLDPSADGKLFALGSDDGSGKSCWVTAFGSSGRELGGWKAPDHSVSVTIGPGGDVYVGQSLSLFGSIWRYKSDGTHVSRLSMTSIPVAMDFGPDGLLYVAGQLTTPADRVTIHDQDGSYLRGWAVNARLEDLAVGPDGSVYVIVWVEADRQFEVRKYDPDGNLLVRLVDIPAVQGTLPPPTATPGGSPGPSATATGISASVTPTATRTPAPTPTTVAPGGLYLPLTFAHGGAGELPTP